MNILTKIGNRAIYARSSILSLLLRLSGFANIRGHWVYTKNLTCNSIVIDLGCNKGDFSQEVNSKFKANCFLVEANKTLLESIDVPYANKFNLAVSDSDGVTLLFISNNLEASSLIMDFEMQWGQAKTVKVECVCWDTLLRKMQLTSEIIDVLKIDIEGAEVDLIESLGPIELKRIKQITVEFHDWIKPELHLKTVSVIKKLTNLGFDQFTTTPDHTWPVEMVFMNKSFLSFNKFQKLTLQIFKKLNPLNYN